MPRSLNLIERKKITQDIKSCLANRSVIWDEKDIEKFVKTLKKP